MEPAPLHIFTGKGGTGKTTIALAYAAHLASSGQRVLVCEVEGRHGLAEVTGAQKQSESEQFLFAAGSGTVHGLAVEPEAALTEYLEKSAPLGMAGWAVQRSGLGTFATNIAPGLRDILLIGKVYEAARRAFKGRPNAYDAIVMDAPPSGRIVNFLTAGDALADVARGGPVHHQARSIMGLLRVPSTFVHVVTLLRELPVTETVQTVRELKERRFHVGRVFCNRVAPIVSPPPQWLDLPLPDGDIAALLTGLGTAAAVTTRQAGWREVLNAQGLSLHDVPLVAGTIGTADIVELAKDLP